MKQYLLFAFSTACLAYSLFFIFATVYHQPLGAKTLMDEYLYGFIVHVPAWLMIFLISGIFNEAIYRIKFLNRIIKLAIFGILILFIIPIFNEPNFDYLVLIFYLFDFLFCCVIFVRLLNKEKLINTITAINPAKKQLKDTKNTIICLILFILPCLVLLKIKFI